MEITHSVIIDMRIYYLQALVTPTNNHTEALMEEEEEEDIPLPPPSEPVPA
jgi:hypothetical protein